jgi:WhiB family redox-sensing transcriptional regulator
MDQFFSYDDYPDFYEHGATPCSESDPDSFFSEDPDPSNSLRKSVYIYENEVKKICHGCQYQARCLEYSLKHPEVHGIWGGTTESQRKRMLKAASLNLGMPSIRKH